MKRYSVVVPAFNEEESISSLLAVLNGAAISSVCQVIVVCNGCSDSTFAISRSFENVTTVESIRGKTHALNAGDQIAGNLFPRLYLDADVRISEESVMELLSSLESDSAKVVGPRVAYELEGRPLTVRAFYRAQETVPRILKWRLEHLAGRGVYGMNRVARERFQEFPTLLADDAFVDRQFSTSEKFTVSTSEILVSTPKTVRQLVRNEIRTVVGNHELSDYLQGNTKEQIGITEGWVASWRDPKNFYLVVWSVVKIWVRIRVLLRRNATTRVPWR